MSKNGYFHGKLGGTEGENSFARKASLIHDRSIVVHVPLPSPPALYEQKSFGEWK